MAGSTQSRRKAELANGDTRPAIQNTKKFTYLLRSNGCL
jgi:hypothetical protein